MMADTDNVFLKKFVKKMNAKMKELGMKLAKSLGEILLVIIIVCTAGGLIFTAYGHYYDPAHFGLWVSSDTFIFGLAGHPGKASEVLGSGIYIYAFLMTCAAFFSVSEIWKNIRQRFRAE